MAIEILMPALSPTMTEGNLAKWHKKEGDKVKPGDVIAEIETDKATMEVEAVDSGIIGKIVIPEKTEGVKVNQLIAVLLEANEAKSAADEIIKKHQGGATKSATIKQEVVQKIEQPKVVNSPAPTPTPSKRIFASPLAKRIAEQKGVDLTTIKGSGPHGRIVKEDVLSQRPSSFANTNFQVGRSSEPFRVIPHSNVRKVIAKRLVESKQTVPHFYLTVDCQLDELLKLREQINAKAPKRGDKPAYKISVNDFVIKACAQGLRTVPKANASWSDEGTILYNNVDISVAVAIDDGLITPIIKNTDQKSLAQISDEMKDLAARAKTNSLKPEEFQGGGFSISNLGMYGIKQFNAIINPPQACILAVGAAEQKPVVKNGKLEIATVMSLTISCDHRVIDGSVGAELIQAIKSFIEQPAMMLV